MPIWTEQQLDAAIAANEIGFITLDTSIFDKFVQPTLPHASAPRP